MDNQSQLPSAVEPAPQPIPPEQSKSPVNWKWILIVVIAVFISATTTYFIAKSKSTQLPTSKTSTTPQPTAIPDPTTNWKTYTNSKYSFSLKYPQNFSEESQGKENPVALQLSDGQRSINFIIFTPKTNIQTPTNAEEITIDGQSAKKFVQSEPNSQVEVHINYGDYLYQIIMPINNETKTQDLILFNQILSTFKFIK